MISIFSSKEKGLEPHTLWVGFNKEGVKLKERC